MSVTGSSLSSLGIGSGLDINSIVNSLMTAESAPLNALQTAASGIQSQISEYGQLSSAYSQLQGAITRLQDPATQTALLGLTANTSNASIANASVTGSPLPGSYSLNVTTMAKSEQLVTTGGSASSTDSFTTQSSTLTFQLGSVTGGTLSGPPGTYSGASFTANPTPSVNVSIKSGASLTDICTSINDAKAGVNATLIHDGNQYRIALSSTQTGSSNSLSIQVSGDSALSNLLNHNPSGTQSLQVTQPATDLSGTLNGIAITSHSNTLSNTIAGLTLNVYGQGTAQLNVAQNTGAAAQAVSGFVSAWNGLSGLVSSFTSYDPVTKTAGPLLGDPLAGHAFFSLTSATFGATANASSNLNFNTLASLGITVDSKGKANINSTQLTKALQNDPQALAKIFSTSSGNILQSAASYVENMVGKNGIGGRVSSLNQQISANQKQQDQWTTRLAMVKKNLINQYTAMDQSVSKMQQVGNFLTNQIAQLNKSS